MLDSFKRNRPVDHTHSVGGHEKWRAPSKHDTVQYSSLLILMVGVILTIHHGSRMTVGIIVAGMLDLLGRETFKYFLELSPIVAKRAKEKWRNFRLKTPSEAPLTPEMEWLWCVIFLVTLLIAFGSPLAGSATAVHLAMNGFMAIIAIAGANEWRHHIQRLLQTTWAMTTGKIILSSVAGVLLCLATAHARRFTFSLTHEDPASFPSFVGLMAILMLPALYISALCIGAFLAACASTIVTSIRIVGKGLFGHRDVEQEYPAKEASLDVPATILRPPPSLRRFTRIFRPLSRLVVAAYVLAGAPQADIMGTTYARKAASIVLARLEYWPRPICAGSTYAHAVKLDANRYAIATVKGLDVVLSTVTCTNTSPSSNH
jgi:hypothetical protein